MYGTMISVSTISAEVTSTSVESSAEDNLMARVYLREGEYEGDDLRLGQYLETNEMV
jgi:hypothetical protein